MSMNDSTWSGPPFNSLEHTPDMHLEIAEMYPDLSEDEVEEAVTYFHAAVGGGWPALPGIVDQIKRQRFHRAVESLRKQFDQPEHKEEHKMDANEVADAVESRNEIFRLKSALFDAEVRIQGLTGDLEGTARSLVEKEDLIERITVRLHELAEEQGWCGVFDREMAAVGLRPRLQKHTVRARMIRTKDGELQEFFIEAYIATGTSEEEATATMADHPGVKDLVDAGWELTLAWIYEDRDNNDDEDYY